MKRLTYNFFINIIFAIIMLTVIIIPTQSIGVNKRLLGDVNGDTVVNGSDMLYILRHIAATSNNKHPEWILKDTGFKFADTDENGKVNANDLLIILRYNAASNSSKIKEKHPDWIVLKQIDETQVEEPTEQEPINILFIGNSKTYYNKMPTKYFESMAEKAGKNVHVETITAGGKTLYWQYSNRDTDGAIRETSTTLAETVKSKKWNYVVLQEQTATSYNNFDKMKSGVTNLVTFIRNNGSPDVKIIYNAIWMDLDDILPTQTEETTTIIEQMKKQLQNNISEIANQTGSIYKLQQQANNNYKTIAITKGYEGTIAYSGNAFILGCKDTETAKNMLLYRIADWRHSSEYGTYLETCCIYSAIFGKPSNDIIVNKVWSYVPNKVDKEFTINSSLQTMLWKIAKQVQ